MRRVVIALSLALMSCSDPEPQPPNVILIGLDTLRADVSAHYGAESSLTPLVDAFADEAVVFERAYSPVSHTLGAHASLLTSLDPPTHGLHRHESVLSPEVATLPEILSERGYQTAAFVNGGFLDPKFGFDRGFETYSSSQPLQMERGVDRSRYGRDAEVTNRDVLAWLDRRGDAPFFLFAHYFDAHSDWKELPYDAPPEFLERYAPDPPPGFTPGSGDVVASAHLLRMNQEGKQYPPAARDYLRALYDAGVAYTDAQIGALLDALRERGLLERSIVVLFSDHGEEFQEHGRLLHTQVYEELVRIPLVMSFPDPAAPDVDAKSLGEWRGRKIDALVSLTDVAPTLLDALGVPSPPAFQGQSLLPLIRGQGRGRPHLHFQNQYSSQLGASDGRWKLVQDVETKQSRLYDLEQDPRERLDLSAREPVVAARLDAEIKRWQLAARRARRAEPETAVLEEGKRQALEALGYVVD